MSWFDQLAFKRGCVIKGELFCITGKQGRPIKV